MTDLNARAIRAVSDLDAPETEAERRAIIAEALRADDADDDYSDRFREFLLAMADALERGIKDDRSGPQIVSVLDDDGSVRLRIKLRPDFENWPDKWRK